MNSNFDFEGLSKDEIEIKLRNYIASSKEDPLYNESRLFRLRILQIENLVNKLSDIRAEEISQKLLIQIEMDKLRQEVINRLAKDPSNKSLQQTAQQFMQTEKDHGFFNPENWKDFQNF